MQYAELHCKSNFSFLEGASHPAELADQAHRLGYRALAVTDRNSLAGVVRAHTAAKDVGLKLLIGAELHFTDATPVVVWATDRASYGRLCQLLSAGRLRAEKGECELHWQDLVDHQQGLLAGAIVPSPRDRAATEASPTQDVDLRQALGRFHDLFGDRGYLLCSLQRGVDDREQLARMIDLSRQTSLPLVAAGDVHYHSHQRMLVHDLVTAIRLGTTIDSIQEDRFANSQRHLRSLDEIAEIFGEQPELLERSCEIADRCNFRLDELRYEYPKEDLAPDGVSAIDYLKQLAWHGAKQRYPEGVPQRLIEMLRHETQLIEELHYEAYFLTVWDAVRFARSRGILCQGRGSAANSAVCYCLGVTSINPAEMDLLFERFISRERAEAPDIDVDFEHQRREEVLQYLYEKYGRDRCGMTATVTSYRTKSAIREVGKALGVSLDCIDALAKVAERYGQEDFPDLAEKAGLPLGSEVGQRFLHLVESLRGFPRHLSQHVGGMVMTQGLLSELCPIENAAMEGRTVIQWDKDDLDELGILKVDCLSLGMLSAIHRCFDMVENHSGRALTLATIPPDDRATYDMICAADTVGVFQIESRAQMSMLPRLRPRCYYDLVIEVAIVRPGPIQGNMVHPYLQARQDRSQVKYPSEAIRGVLEKTLGVPIFQEQAMKLAVVAAGFTPGEADQLRRAMAAWRRPGVIDQFRKKLLEGMQANGFGGEFAEHVFTQIRGFGEYGFPESHAASFALLVYASAYLKCHYPAAYCASLLNSQPMGFYSAAQLVRDAQQHGVQVLPPDVNDSDWDCTLQPIDPAAGGSGNSARSLAVRLGLRLVRGLAESTAQQVVDARNASGRFTGLADLTRRAGLSSAQTSQLADADALRSMSPNRRAAIWESLAQDDHPERTPLFAENESGDDDEVPTSLGTLSSMQEVHADYSTLGLSLRAHPISFYREHLNELQVSRADQLPPMRDGQHIRVAGLVVLRQRPGTAKGITFVTLEDETGAMNLVLFPKVWQQFFTIARTSNFWLVHGKLENRKGVIHVIVGRLEDLSEQFDSVDIQSRDFH
ncbi:Error-prone DNA polymerase [Rosistilla ulvae]|uniref:Error-prone DNA polymerase n=1 Tax=Rosistilla ulvae TaxID=1930277 RepID=A0A517M7Z4_9BACT|nr:error-prone DNA polymerase [Rosistilla ulvae]QDS91018.1 Error-prone DNA polymerase [Rosistilla ulvae]